MHPCLSWITLTMLTASHAAPAAATAPAPARAPASTPAATPTSAPAAAAKSASDPEARAEQAATLYSQRRYLDAAVILEDLWASVHEPRDLFNAALARLALGHRAHAIRYWEIYLQQPAIPADGRDQAQSRIKKAQAAAVAVNLRAVPSAMSEVGVTYTLRRKAADPKDSRPAIVVELAPGAPEFNSGGRTVYLDPGEWELSFEAHGFQASPQTLTIKSGQLGFQKEVTFSPDPLFRHVTVQVDPPEAIAAGGTVTLQRIALSGETLTCQLGAAGPCAFKVPPGDWEVTVSAPGYQRYTEKVVLGAQPAASFAIALVPTIAAPTPAAAPATPAPGATQETPAEPPKQEIVPRATRIKLSTGLVASGIPLFIGGLALGITGSNTYQDRTTAGASSSELLPAIRMRSAGIGLVGAAVGLWATGLTAEYDVRPRVWFAELGVGAAFLLTGSVWATIGTSRWNNNQLDRMHCSNSEGIDCFASHRMAAGFFLGAGTAMLVGSTLGLLVQRKHLRGRPRAALSPYFAGAGGAGLMVQGRF